MWATPPASRTAHPVATLQNWFQKGFLLAAPEYEFDTLSVTGPSPYHRAHLSIVLPNQQHVSFESEYVSRKKIARESAASKAVEYVVHGGHHQPATPRETCPPPESYSAVVQVFERLTTIISHHQEQINCLWATLNTWRTETVHVINEQREAINDLMAGSDETYDQLQAISKQLLEHIDAWKRAPQTWEELEVPAPE